MTRAHGLAIFWIAAHLGIAGVGPVRAQAEDDPLSSLQLRSHASPAGEIDYLLQVPEGWGPERHLVVMLHGCLQDARDFAAGSAMAAEGAREGFAVLFPQQDPSHNPQRCWNWYAQEQQSPTGPEVTRLISLLEAVGDELEIAPGRVDLAGISAGAAMANILAVTHPVRFRRLALHSGIAWGAAGTLAEGLAAMASAGPADLDLSDPRLDALRAGGGPEAVLIVQGAEDASVAPVNGTRTAERWVALLGLAGADLRARPGPRETPEGGEVHRTEWSDAEGRPRVTLVEVAGLGHAWSGGSAAGSFTDPARPSATGMIVDFFGLRR